MVPPWSSEKSAHIDLGGSRIWELECSTIELWVTFWACSDSRYPALQLERPCTFPETNYDWRTNTSSPDSNGSCTLWELVNIALNLSNWYATSSVRVSFPYAVRTSKREHWAIMAYGNYSTLVLKRKTHTQKPETENRTKNVFRGHIPVVRKTHNYDSLNYKE